MRIATVAAAALALAGCQAEQPAAAPAHDAHSPQAKAQPASESARAYDEAMARMHRDMGAAPADPDEAFVRMMIPHHQGAIDMAEIELRYGKDEATRQLAREVIEAQRREIAQMEAWLAARGEATDDQVQGRP